MSLQRGRAYTPPWSRDWGATPVRFWRRETSSSPKRGNEYKATKYNTKKIRFII
jgi:hypothetical protein